MTTHFINDRLGLSLSLEEITQLLKNVEMKVSDEDGHSDPNPGEKDYPVLIVFPPFWRTDLELPEDIVEEVGRLYGFDKLPRELPKRSIKPAPINKNRQRAQTIREKLASSGANEVLTYSFIHENVMKRAGQDAAHAYRLTNALSPDLQYYRLSLTPSLLDKLHMNIKAGHESFALFELNKVHYKGEMDADEPNVPNEDSHVAFVIAYDDKQKPSGSPYYHARKYLSQIANLDAVQLVPLASFDVTKDEWGSQLTAAYEPKRSAVIVKDDQIWGVVGEYKYSVKRAFKLPNFVAGFELHQDVLSDRKAVYTPLSKYPSSERDICFQVQTDIAYGDIIDVMQAKRSDETVTVTITPVDIYQPETGNTKNITIRLAITSGQKTLSGGEVTQLVEQLTSGVVSKFGATIV